MRIVIAILCFTALPVLLESCGGDNGCGPLNGPKEFTINDIFLTDAAMGVTPPQPVPHSISPKALIFEFEMSVTYASLNEPYKGTMAAYACDPASPTSKQKFTALKITSDAELVTNNSQTFAAGEDLSALFLQTNFNKNDVMHSTEFHFTPVFSVAAKSNHSFKFSFTLDDGQDFDLQSGLYELLP